MATENQVPVPQQPRGKVKNDGNRRVCGDISNFVAGRASVVEGKSPPQISRPITRSFAAKLLANSKATAAAENKKPVSVVKAVKRKIHTLSSVLSARSKAACGIVDKPEESILDIDASDVFDQLAVADYVEDLYKFYKLSENSTRLHDYIGSQNEINEKMRALLADWLILVHHKYQLMPETLYLTFYIIDRYLSMEQVPSRKLQLVGASSILIASKYEEIWAPRVHDFINLPTYSQEMILAMEKSILNKLKWTLTVPTTYVFLVRFIKAAMCDKEMEHMVFFFSELGLLQYSMIMFCPSMVAASAVYAARCTLKKSPPWTKTLKRYTGFSETQLLDCAQILVEAHSAAPECKLKAVYNKYSSVELGAVALHPPAVGIEGFSLNSENFRYL